MRAARFMIAVVSLVSMAGWAQDAGIEAEALPAPPAPTADEVRKVMDYLERGKDAGPVLIDLVPCLKVDQTKGSPTLFTCLEKAPETVKKGTQVFSWVQWFSPRGGVYEDITVQWSLNGEVRKTDDMSVKSEGRTRSWRALTLSKPGTWTVKLMRQGKELGSASIKAE